MSYWPIRWNRLIQRDNGLAQLAGHIVVRDQYGFELTPQVVIVGANHIEVVSSKARRLVADVVENVLNFRPALLIHENSQ